MPHVSAGFNLRKQSASVYCYLRGRKCGNVRFGDDSRLGTCIGSPAASDGSGPPPPDAPPWPSPNGARYASPGQRPGEQRAGGQPRKGGVAIRRAVVPRGRRPFRAVPSAFGILGRCPRLKHYAASRLHTGMRPAPTDRNTFPSRCLRQIIEYGCPAILTDPPGVPRFSGPCHSGLNNRGPLHHHYRSNNHTGSTSAATILLGRSLRHSQPLPPINPVTCHLRAEECAV